MTQLIRFLSLRHAWRHKSRSLLTLSGVALGVAVVVAIQTVNHSILESFRRMIDSIAGRATLQVAAGPAGVPEDLWEEIEALAYVRYVTPVVQATVRVPDLGNETVLLLGIDFTGDEKFRDYSFSRGKSTVDDPLAFLNDPDAVLVSERLASKYRLAVGDAVRVTTLDRRQKLTIRGVLEADGPAKAFGGSFMVMDIFAAQALWGKEGRFDRFDVITDDFLPVSQARSSLAARLGNAYNVELPKTRGDSAQTILASFQTGLNVGGFVALLVGLFMIYNTMQITVAQRRREISIARAVGAKRNDILRLFVGEALVLGAAASCLGVLLGLWLGRLLLHSVSASVSLFFLRVNPENVFLDFRILAAGLASGIAASGIAAIGPARTASSVTPVEGLRFESRIARFRPGWTTANARIAYLLALACALLWLTAPNVTTLYWGYGAQLACVLSLAFLAPTLLSSVWPTLRPLTRGVLAPPERLAYDQLPRQVSRAAVTLSAIMLGFGMVVEVDTYIASVKRTLERWVEQAIPADVFITSGSKLAGLENQPMRADLETELGRWPEVASVDKVRIVEVETEATLVPLLSNIPEVYLRHVPRELTGASWQEVLPRLNAEPALLAADNFLRRFHKKIGDRIEIRTANGAVSMPIVASIEDYTSDRGLLVMSRKQFVRHFHDELVDSFDLYLHDGRDAERVRQRILKTFGGSLDLFALTNREMRSEIFRVIDDTYRVVKVMEIIAVLVSILGIINTLLASVLERTREIGVLRALGATRRQVARMVLAEGGYLTLGGMVLGLLLGILLTLIIFAVIIPAATGWRLRLDVPLGRISAVAAAGLLASTAAAYLPARFASRLNIVKAIEYE